MERELARVADLDDDRALDRVASTGEGHLPRYAFEILDLGHRRADIFPVLFQISREPAGFLDRLLNEQHGVPGKRGHIVGHVAVFRFIPVDERLGRPGRTRGGVMGAEKQPIAFFAAEFYRFRRRRSSLP